MPRIWSLSVRHGLGTRPSGSGAEAAPAGQRARAGTGLPPGWSRGRTSRPSPRSGAARPPSGPWRGSGRASRTGSRCRRCTERGRWRARRGAGGGRRRPGQRVRAGRRQVRAKRNGARRQGRTATCVDMSLVAPRLTIMLVHACAVATEVARSSRREAGMLVCAAERSLWRRASPESHLPNFAVTRALDSIANLAINIEEGLA